MELARLREELSRVLEEICALFPKLHLDQAFVVWFLHAFAGASLDDAAESLPGRTADKGVDGIYIDRRLRSICVVQGKLRDGVRVKVERRDEVLGFFQLAGILTGSDDDFEGLLAGINPGARALLSEARRLIKRDYRIEFCYVTTGRFSPSLIAELERLMRNASRSNGRRLRYHVFDGASVLGLLRDWLEGAAPPVPSLELPVEGDEIRRADERNGIRLRVLWMNGYDVAELYRRAEARIFHRNIRGFLGDTEINREMRSTLRSAPQEFIYLNNGVTIVCDDVRPDETRAGQRILVATNPQIINGQQTTRVLADVGDQAKKASVLVRIIVVPHGIGAGDAAYDRIVSQVVQATNHQNPIKWSDLRANDPIQISLERRLRALGYHYVRKRAAKAEIRSQAPTSDFIVTRDELAQAVGATLEQGMPRRLGRERLFHDPTYRTIFRTEDPYFYLVRHWLWTLVDRTARGSSDRQWAKYVVMFFVWERVRPQIEANKATKRAFVTANEHRWKHTRVMQPLAQLVEEAFHAANRYYAKERGRGSERVDLATFFKRKDVYDGFVRFWRSHDNSAIRRARFQKASRAFAAALSALAENL